MVPETKKNKAYKYRAETSVIFKILTGIPFLTSLMIGIINMLKPGPNFWTQLDPIEFDKSLGSLIGWTVNFF